MVAKHRAENADITVVSHRIPADKVGLVGILKIDPATGVHRALCCVHRSPFAMLWALLLVNLAPHKTS